MRGARVLAVILVACGARSSLDTPPLDAGDASPPRCTDALEPGAFTPIAGYCSDGSHRAPTAAPTSPHVAWSLDLDVAPPAAIVVDATGRAFVAGGNTVAVDPSGQLAWTSAKGIAMPFLARGRLMGVDAAGNQLGLVALSKETGDEVSEVTWPIAPSTSLFGTGQVLARGDDTMLVERLSSWGFVLSFDGVSRIDANGDVLWTFANDDCAPGGDFPSPHPFIRIGEDMLIVCESGPRLIDATGKAKRDTPLALSPEPRSIALRPDGHVLYLAHDGTGPSKVIDLDTSGIPHATDLVTFFGWSAAMAADGTLLFLAYDHPLTSLYLVAFATDHVSWSVPLGYPTDSFAPDLMVDENHTAVVATRTTIAAFDSMSGIELWEVPIADPDAGVAAPYLAAAGPHALYVLRDRTLFRLSDF